MAKAEKTWVGPLEPAGPRGGEPQHRAPNPSTSAQGWEAPQGPSCPRSAHNTWPEAQGNLKSEILGPLG